MLSDAIFPLLANTLHMLVYLRLKTRNPLAFAAILLLVNLPVPLLRWSMEANLTPIVPVAAAFLYLFFCMWTFRLLASNDSYSRIFFCGASVMAFTQVLRILVFLVLVYALRLAPDESMRLNGPIYLALFFVLLPFIWLYVRERFRRVLDVAETQKWHVVAVPPLCFSILGAAVTNMIAHNAHAPGMFLAGLFTPLAILAYFYSMYSFLMNKNEKLIYRRRLAAAEQLESTYDFYNRELADREGRLRTLRHDFRHLVAHLDILARERDFDGILREIRAVSAAGDGVAVTPFCENRTVNAVVSFQFARAEKLGVACTAKAFVPEKLAQSEAELALILGNALENCVKGAGPLGEGGYISFEARPAKGYMMFRFANNHDRSKYAKGEGAGLASIRSLCGKYEGWLETRDENAEFRLTVFLRML